MKRQLKRLSEHERDLLVIGGGFYGICVARDAALRGLSVALVEKEDFGHATSANSLRIIHGGLRHLLDFDLPRARQAAREQLIWMKIAPHLVRPLPFLIPTYRNRTVSRKLLSIGLLLNDAIGVGRDRLQDQGRIIPRGRTISRAECLRLFPLLGSSDLTGAGLFYDGQIQDAGRLLIALGRSAAEAGAELANYFQVTRIPIEKGRVSEVTGRDLLTGDTVTIRAKVVVNCTGPWLDHVAGLGDKRRCHSRGNLSKAFNLQVNRQVFPAHAVGLYCREGTHHRNGLLGRRHRLLFVTPAGSSSLIGTAHLPYDGVPDDCRVADGEIDSFLREINDALPAAALRREEIGFVQAGLVPAGEYKEMGGPPRLLRRYSILDHGVNEGMEGFVSVRSVKLTEARQAAEEVVDLVLKKLGSSFSASKTARQPVYGGEIDQLDLFLRTELNRRPGGLSTETVRRLIYRYGSAYQEVIQNSAPDLESVRRLSDSCPVIYGEVLHAMREEMAQRLSDVVFRRAGLASTGRVTESCLKACAGIMAREAGWTAERTAAELAATRKALLLAGAHV